MAETSQTGLVRATQVAHDAVVSRSPNGLRFASFGETGVTVPDLASMVEAVPPAISAALSANTYFFVPVALREAEGAAASRGVGNEGASALVAASYSDEIGERAICHRNVALGAGEQGIFISTRLMGDRFALCFEFFINVAHAFADETGVPQRFADLVWGQAMGALRGEKARGESSMDAFEARNLAMGLPVNFLPEPRGSGRAQTPRRGRPVALSASGQGTTPPVVKVDDKERGHFVAAAYSDALAIYLLSLAVDFDYADLREREYPLLEAPALAARLRLMAELFPPNAGYEFAVRYRRRG